MKGCEDEKKRSSSSATLKLFRILRLFFKPACLHVFVTFVKDFAGLIQADCLQSAATEKNRHFYRLLSIISRWYRITHVGACLHDLLLLRYRLNWVERRWSRKMNEKCFWRSFVHGLASSSVWKSTETSRIIFGRQLIASHITTRQFIAFHRLALRKYFLNECGEAFPPRENKCEKESVNAWEAKFNTRTSMYHKVENRIKSSNRLFV